ncbi:alkylation response protein AidB-like acyl-CoA dehydrogenase [Jatrophihabitans sp. GAS493]|uniref:acyl-CoA dehydrogenase family protein n=1 Tax=Jatrophihabitans sp. GAS493 TaxID=1907575 RepID=UPI000BB8B131|nr:acyl-CoA dehydrogenase family protein [Jatrophihabitans sp. GAS493]SOD72120.1 alkylation response protein AidB-like acyl-CoA dehydrogenase [Jatrophihabitans sp. GAS493]
MDFALDVRTEQLRAEVRQMIREHLTPAVAERVAATGGSRHDPQFHAEMARRGWITPNWPEREGGLGWDRGDLDVMHEEFVVAGAPVMGVALTRIVAETLRRVGTEEQKQRILGPVRAGELVMCLGYTEPEAGSDLASVRTAATKVEGGWVITGQKIFTTLADQADYVWLLARTDPQAPRHAGMTIFLVPTNAPGFSLAPVHTLSGERTNITYYSEVFVDDTALVGQPGDGWRIVSLALAFERGGEFTGLLRRLVESTTEWLREAGPVVTARAARRLGRAIAEAEVSRLLGAQASAARSAGDGGYVQGAMAKVYATQSLQRTTSSLLDATGEAGMLNPGSAAAPGAGDIQLLYRESQIATIYGGSNEVLKTVIAQGRLGLPRATRA